MAARNDKNRSSVAARLKPCPDTKRFGRVVLSEAPGPHNCQKQAIMGHPCKATLRNEVQEIAMYAVIRAGGKQYRVAPGDVIEIEKLPQSSGENVQFDDV